MKGKDKVTQEVTTAFLEHADSGWLLTLAVPAEVAVIALEMLGELVAGLSNAGDDSQVAAAAGALVGLFEDAILQCMPGATAAEPVAA